MLFGRRHQGVKPIAGLHWGWLLIAAGAHAAGFYALTHGELAQLGGTDASTIPSGGAPIKVSLLMGAPTLTDAPASEKAPPRASPSQAPAARMPEPVDVPAEPTPVIAQAAPKPVVVPPEPTTIAGADPSRVAPNATEPPDTSMRNDPAPSPPVAAITTPGASQAKPVASAPSATPPPAPHNDMQAALMRSTAGQGRTGNTATGAGEAPLQTPAGPAADTPANDDTARFDAAHLRNTPPAYPHASRRRGEEGQVILRVLVSAHGRANKVEIAESSGHSRLDRAALDAVSRWRFEPARDGEQTIESWVRVPVAFRLERT